MFVQINAAYAALRDRIGGRRPEPGRYVRKAKVTGRRVYARPVSHRADSRRPSYSHPATRARRAFREAFTAPRVRRATRTAVPNAPARRQRPATPRDAAPSRSTRAIGRAVVRYRTVNASVRAWLADPRHGARSHRAPDAGHRRAHVYLPSIGWCWDTEELPKVSMQ